MKQIIENWNNFINEQKTDLSNDIRLATRLARKYAPKELRNSKWYKKARFVPDDKGASHGRKMEGGTWQGKAPWYFIKVVTFHFPDINISPGFQKFITKVKNASYPFLKKYKASILLNKDLFDDGADDDFVAPQKGSSNTIFINVSYRERRSEKRKNILRKHLAQKYNTNSLPKDATEAINYTKIIEFAETLVHEVAHAEDKSALEFNQYIQQKVKNEIMTAYENGVFKPDENTTEEDLQTLLSHIYFSANDLRHAKKRSTETYAYSSQIKFYENLIKSLKSQLARKPSRKLRGIIGFCQENLDDSKDALNKHGAPSRGTK